MTIEMVTQELLRSNLIPFIILLVRYFIRKVRSSTAAFPVRLKVHYEPVFWSSSHSARLGWIQQPVFWLCEDCLWSFCWSHRRSVCCLRGCQRSIGQHRLKKSAKRASTLLNSTCRRQRARDTARLPFYDEIFEQELLPECPRDDSERLGTILPS